MNLRMVAAGAVVLALQSSAVRADEPPADASPGAVPWTDVSARVAKGDAPLYLQLHVSAAGRVALRSLAGKAGSAAWKELGRWSVVGDPEAQMSALKALHDALFPLIDELAADRDGMDEDKHPRARLFVDAERDARWRWVQWALAVASAPRLKIYRLTFLSSEPPGTFDVDLPKDRAQHPEPVKITPFRDIEAKLFRDNLEKGVSEHRTKIRVGDTFTVLLPKGPWPVDREAAEARRSEEARVMAQVTAAIAAAWAQQGKDPQVAGEIKTPFPKGQAVPYADVMHALRSFREAGIANALLEGAAPPKEGPWDVHRWDTRQPRADTAASGPVPWSDVRARVAKGDAPLFLQVHLGASGRLALRALRAAAWSDLGAWSLAGEPPAQMKALKGLHGALVKQLDPAVSPDLRDESGHARARLIVDAEPGTPWRFVQWTLATAASPQTKVFHLTFLVPGASETYDVDLPMDRGLPNPPPAPGDEDVTLVIVAMFRPSGDPARGTTTLKVAHRISAVRAGGVPIEPELKDPPGALPEPARPPRVVSGGDRPGRESPAESSDAIELPAAEPAGPASVGRWQGFERLLREFAGKTKRRIGGIKAPPPTGGSVPYVDVVGVLGSLLRVGCETVHFEGAAAPLSRKDGGGWGFGR